MMKRIFFEKTGVMRYLGHLDLLKLVQRTLQRANLPMAFSKGFNPHMIVGFAAPLSVGLGGLSEIMEIELTRDPGLDGIMAMNNLLPEGLRIVAVEDVANGNKAAALLYSAIYRAILPVPLVPEGEAVNKLLNASEIIVENDGKTRDIRPDIFELSQLSETEISMTIATGSAKNLRPQWVLSELFRQSGLSVDLNSCEITREKLILRSAF